jgi:hypothetical protein
VIGALQLLAIIIRFCLPRHVVYVDVVHVDVVYVDVVYVDVVYVDVVYVDLYCMF